MRKTSARLQFPPKPVRPKGPDDPLRDVTVSLDNLPTTIYAPFGSSIGRGDEGQTLKIELINVDATTGREITAIKTYTDFILAGVTEGSAERADPTLTFGFPVTQTSSGEQTKIYVFQLNCLINKMDGDSRLRLIDAFTSDLRASKLATSGNRQVRLSYRNRIVRGAPVSLDMQYSADQPSVAGLVLSVFVIDEYVA